jgi:hypothetical protein
VSATRGGEPAGQTNITVHYLVEYGAFRVPYLLFSRLNIYTRFTIIFFYLDMNIIISRRNVYYNPNLVDSRSTVFKKIFTPITSSCSSAGVDKAI